MLVVLATIACRKETAVTRDTIKPKSTLTISGDGINKTFYSDSFYSEQLDLKTNTKYHIVLSGSDTSGFVLTGNFTTQNITQGNVLEFDIYSRATDYTNLVNSIVVRCLVSFAPFSGYG